MIGMTDISGVIRVREPFCRESFGNALSGSEDELPVHIVRQVEVPVLGHPLSERVCVLDNVHRELRSGPKLPVDVSSSRPCEVNLGSVGFLTATTSGSSLRLCTLLDAPRSRA